MWSGDKDPVEPGADRAEGTQSYGGRGAEKGCIGCESDRLTTAIAGAP